MLFRKCKTVCTNLPGDFVSVVLYNNSNDFLEPTGVSILNLVHCTQLSIITILTILNFNAVNIDE